MDASNLLSFQGRIGRAAFWGGTLATLGVAALGFYAAREMGYPAAAFLLAAAALLMLCAIGAKRMHDLNASGWWVMLFYILPVFFCAIAQAIGFDGTAGALYVFAALGVGLGLFVMGGRAGTRGANAFGGGRGGIPSPEIIPPPEPERGRSMHPVLRRVV